MQRIEGKNCSPITFDHRRGHLMNAHHQDQPLSQEDTFVDLSYKQQERQVDQRKMQTQRARTLTSHFNMQNREHTQGVPSIRGSQVALSYRAEQPPVHSFVQNMSQLSNDMQTENEHHLSNQIIKSAPITRIYGEKPYKLRKHVRNSKNSLVGQSAPGFRLEGSSRRRLSKIAPVLHQQSTLLPVWNSRVMACFQYQPDNYPLLMEVHRKRKIIETLQSHRGDLNVKSQRDTTINDDKNPCHTDESTFSAGAPLSSSSNKDGPNDNYRILVRQPGKQQTSAQPSARMNYRFDSQK